MKWHIRTLAHSVDCVHLQNDINLIQWNMASVPIINRDANEIESANVMTDK